MAADADAFVWAAARSKLAEVELYLANAGDVNAKHSETGMTALSCATCHGHVAVAKLILDAYQLPQNALVQEICITPTRQKY